MDFNLEKECYLNGGKKVNVTVLDQKHQVDIQ